MFQFTGLPEPVALVIRPVVPTRWLLFALVFALGVLLLVPLAASRLAVPDAQTASAKVANGIPVTLMALRA